jgi:hypothetical protein
MLGMGVDYLYGFLFHETFQLTKSIQTTTMAQWTVMDNVDHDHHDIDDDYRHQSPALWVEYGDDNHARNNYDDSENSNIDPIKKKNQTRNRNNYPRTSRITLRLFDIRDIRNPRMMDPTLRMRCIAWIKSC